MFDAAATAPQRGPNQLQQAAIDHSAGPMLVRAGAGTGKTTVMVERIVRLVKDGHATPSEILAISYTNKTAQQLRLKAEARIEAVLGQGSAAGLRASTFHAICFEVLQRNQAGFKLLDNNNLWVLLRRELDQRRLPLRHFLKAANPSEFLKDFLDFIDRCNDELVDASQYRRYVERLRKGEVPLPRVSTEKEADSLTREEVLARCQEIADVYTFVEELLAKNGWGTYGSMITRSVELLKNKPELRKKEQLRTKFILIDEFQDCNLAQIEFTTLIAGDRKNVFAVGDPDQGIYRFRGASSAAFDEFVSRFPETKSISLKENYRSTSAILKAAFAVIEKNPDIASADLGPGRVLLESAREKSEAEQPLVTRLPEVVIADDTAQSAFDVAEAISNLHQAGAPWSDFAVLYRSHAHRAEVLNELSAKKIPFVVVGIDLLKTDVLRDLVALLQVLISADDISLFRLTLLPQFGIDLSALQHRMAHAKGKHLVSTLEGMPAGKAMLRSLQNLRSALHLESSAVSGILRGCAKFLQLDTRLEEFTRFEGFVADWEALGITESRSLPEFLQYLDYFVESGGSIKSEELVFADAVRLMTVHAAKGLEFPHVFVLRVSSTSFPLSHRETLFEFPKELLKSRMLDFAADTKELHSQEERRLFYVAITRAKDTLTLHAKAARGKERVPGVYLRELVNRGKSIPVVASRAAVPVLVDLAAESEDQPEWLTLEPVPKSKELELSDYAIEMYEACPLKFKLSRDWRLPSEPVGSMQFGAVMHRVLSDFVQSVIAKRTYTDEQALELFTAGLNDARLSDPLQHELYQKLGREQLLEFLETFREGALPDVIGTELSFNIQIGGIKIRGRIDRIDRIGPGQVEVIDYKTGNPKSLAFTKNSLQLSIYAIAAKRQWGHDPAKLVIHNLQDNSRVEVVPDSARLIEVENKVTEVAEAIMDGEFRATPGFHCRWCGYNSICPETREKLYKIEAAAAAAAAE